MFEIVKYGLVVISMVVHFFSALVRYQFQFIEILSEINQSKKLKILHVTPYANDISKRWNNLASFYYVSCSILYSVYYCRHERSNIFAAKIPASARIVEDSGTDIQQVLTNSKHYNKHVIS